MAKASIERTLKRMHAVLDDAYVRGQLDKAPQKVIVTLFNITQAFKHGYGLAQQKQKNLPFVEDEVFEKAAEKALSDLVDHLNRSSSAASLRVGGVQQKYVIFVQPKGTNTTPFRKLHKAGVDYLDEHLSSLGTNIKLGTQARRSMGAAKHRSHLKKATVGTGQLALGLKYLMASPKFADFVNSVEAQKLTDKFDLDYYYRTTGKGRGSKLSVKKNVEIGVSVVPNTENPPGKLPQDWLKLQKEFDEVLYEWASKQEWWNQKGSPTPLEEFTSMGYELSLSELEKTKLKIKVKNRKQFKKVSKNNVHVVHEERMDAASRLKTNTTTAAELQGGQAAHGNASKYKLHTLVALINQRLPDTLRENMVAPRLVYRTGRFANSVSVNIAETAKGFPSIGYNYMRYPYATFAEGGKMYTPDRDPIPLIENSIREIALELAIGRYYIRRS